MNVWTDEFKRGDKVQVWDDDSSNKHKRIFLTYIEGAYKPFICTANEERFYNNNSFVTVGWKYAERIPEKKYWTFPDGSSCGVDNV